MEYPKDKEEFYRLMNEKRREIDSMNLPDSEKNNLYNLVNETISRYEENKEVSIKSKESIEGIKNGLDVIGKNLCKILESAEKIYNSLPAIEKLAEYARNSMKEDIIRKNPNVIN